MDSKEIKLLLEKYLEGNTNLIEEEKLRLFFSTSEVIPEEWEGYRIFFGYFNLAKKESFPKASKKQKNIFRPWMAAAALIAVVISIQFYSVQTKILSPEEEEAQFAFMQFKSNMEKVSSHLNNGAEKVAYLNYWNQTTQKLIK